MAYHGQMMESPDNNRIAPTERSLPVHDARRLVGKEATALIVLDEKTYTLRITRAGKLILTK